jgi:Glycosyl transferase family 2
MKLVMTLLARNEADIVDAHIAFHLSAGVDFVVATANRSEDGTDEILARYERAGRLHLIREPGDDMRQARWVTRMARLAATEFGADWVINSDADEFWWPRGGSLKDVLRTVPERFGVVRGCWRHFLPRPDDDGPFYERMTVRLCTPAHPGDKRTIYHAHQKVVHRATPDVEVEGGNHNADGTGLVPLRLWHPIEVLHFSLRSVAQLERKGAGGWLRNPEYVAPLHQLRFRQAVTAGTVEGFYRAEVVDGPTLERGVSDGTFALDTRLRDALRTLRASDGSFPIPAAGHPSPLTFSMPDVTETAAYAGEASTLGQIDGIVRAEQRVAALEARIGALEHRRRLARR